jgi:uncharacterized protein YdeI (YjbR/CyaY-like superfamily)
MAEPKFFKDGAEWRKWLDKHHETESELLLGFWKTKTKKPGITYKNALEEALCFGWIDAVRKSLGEESYTIRFTRRRRDSIWSQVNLTRYMELDAEGRIKPAGRAIHDARDPKKVYRYSSEVMKELEGEELAELKKNKKAFEFWQNVAPSYRRVASWWVIQAKREETKQRRLSLLIEYSAKGERVPATLPKKK